MALDRGNPISLEVLSADVSPDKDIDEQIAELVDTIKDVDADMLGWLRKQADLTRLRISTRQRRNTPWRGSANVNVPVIDGIIRRWKPGVASLVLDADPIAFFTAQSEDDIDAARAVEPFFTYLFREHMQTTYQTVQLVDTIAWRGHAYTREGWKYETRREARIVPVNHMFPDGVDAFVEQAMARAAREGEDTSPEDIVMQSLEDEYNLDRQDEREGEMLLAVTAQILQGAEYVKLVYRRVHFDRPDWMVIDPINVIVPQNQDPECAEFFCILHQKTPDQLITMAIDGLLPRRRTQAVIDESARAEDESAGAGVTQSARERIQDIKDKKAGKAKERSQDKVGQIPIWEIYCNLDINGDGERERCIVWYAPRQRTTLAVLDYPFPFDCWPVTYYPFEAMPRPIDNQGIAEKLRSFQRIITAFHNARLDAAQITLAPVLAMRVTGGNYRKSIKWHPGSVIPLANVNDLQPVLHDKAILPALLQEQQINQRLAETYIGVFDATLTNLEQAGERRTAAEINAITSISGNIFGLDAKIFQVAFSKSLTKVWQLYEDLGPREMFFRVTGEQKPQLARKSELVRNYDIRAAGTPASTNRTFQISNLERIMQLLFQPQVLTTGRFDFAEVVAQWLKLVDFNMSKKVIRSAEDSAVAQTLQQAASIISGEEAPPI